VTSTYNSTLLNEPVEAPAPQHTRSVTRVVSQPMLPAGYAPMQQQPMYIQAAPARSGSGFGSTLVLTLLVVLVGMVALIGAYFAAQNSAPSAREANLMGGLAARESFRAGQERGIVQGREQALQNASTTIALRTAAAREQAYNAAFNRGLRRGRASYTAPRYTGGGYSDYRAPRFGGIGSIEVAQAFGQAQQLAGLTGAPVDVEIYG
jgi:hypothetical protein